MNLRVENLSFSYHAGEPVLRNVSLEIRPGRVTGLFGPNGSGKSTLLRCLTGGLRPQAGAVWLDGRRVAELPPPEIARHLAVVPQDTPATLAFTALEMVLLGRFAHWSLGQVASAEDVRIARESLARVDAGHLADRCFAELSGGERQRVVVARALAQQTRVLLFDEPAAHLDVRHQIEVYQLAEWLAGEGHTVLMVCHDLFLAPLHVAEVVLLKAGRIFAQGPVAETLTPGNIAAVFNCGLELAWPGPNQVRAGLCGS